MFVLFPSMYINMVRPKLYKLPVKGLKRHLLEILQPYYVYTIKVRDQQSPYKNMILEICTVSKICIILIPQKINIFVYWIMWISNSNLYTVKSLIHACNLYDGYTQLIYRKLLTLPENLILLILAILLSLNSLSWITLEYHKNNNLNVVTIYSIITSNNYKWA